MSLAIPPIATESLRLWLKWHSRPPFYNILQFYGILQQGHLRFYGIFQGMLKFWPKLIETLSTNGFIVLNRESSYRTVGISLS